MNNVHTPDHHPRYVVREITGYGLTAGRAAPATTVWVADSWYGWVEVARFDVNAGGWPAYPVRRADADTLCATLNAEHDAWLRAG